MSKIKSKLVVAMNCIVFTQKFNICRVMWFYLSISFVSDVAQQVSTFHLKYWPGFRSSYWLRGWRSDHPIGPPATHCRYSIDIVFSPNLITIPWSPSQGSLLALPLRWWAHVMACLGNSLQFRRFQLNSFHRAIKIIIKLI